MRQSTERGMSVRRYGHGPINLIYLHGLGEAGDSFAPLFAQTALNNVQFTHVVPDLPGYGRSEWPEEASGLDALAESLAGWIRELQIKPVFVGHSLGGVLAVLIAESAPDIARAVVTIEGNVSLGDCTFSGRIAAQDLDAYETGGHEEILEQLYASGRDNSPERFYYATFRFADPRSSHRHSRELVEISRSETMPERMARLSVPCVFVAGVPDGLASRSLELLKAAGVHTVTVGPAGHWVYADQPAEVARLIARIAGA